MAIGSAPAALAIALGLSTTALAADDTGARLYFNHCAACHGDDAEGTGPVAATMRVATPNLRALAQRNGGVFPAESVAAYIDGREVTAPHGDRQMPIWGDVFRGPEQARRIERCAGGSRRSSRSLRSCSTARPAARRKRCPGRARARRASASELPHHSRAMQLDGALAHAEIHGDDFVRLAAHDTMHDLALARREQLPYVSRISFSSRASFRCSRSRERLVDTIDEVLITKRLLDEVGRSDFMALTAIGTSP